MTALKKYWRMIGFLLACLASVGAGGWAYLSSDAITTRMQSIDRLINDVRNAGRNPVNTQIIEQQKRLVEKANAEFEAAMESALLMQTRNSFEAKIGPDGQPVAAARSTLIPDVLPAPKRSANAIDFRDAYKRALGELPARLRGRSKATPAEVADIATRLAQLKRSSASSSTKNPWGPRSPSRESGGAPPANRSLAELLAEYPRARAAEEIATSIYMYVDNNAFGPHPLANSDDPPDAVQIWQAQMSLWIQQDMAAALADVNEARARQWRAEKHEDRLWVAHMPVKRLIAVRIGDRLGRGGGSNIAGDGFPASFTGIENNAQMFVVPIQIELIVEEATLMSVIEQVCRTGFYTPIGVSMRAVRLDPLQEEYIYGEEPVIEVRLSFEGYYFRKAFDPWIPKVLKPILSTPGAIETVDASRR
jgi:hypothetical protein